MPANYVRTFSKIRGYFYIMLFQMGLPSFLTSQQAFRNSNESINCGSFYRNFV